MEKPHGGDLRKGRQSLVNQVYLITTATFDRQQIFTNMDCARVLVRVMMGESEDVETLAFVVMPDHLHWIFQLTKAASIDSVVQRIKSISSHRINRLLNRTGSVWQSGFHDHAIRRDEDLEWVSGYVVENPVRAGLVKRVGDYSHWDAYWV